MIHEMEQVGVARVDAVGKLWYCTVYVVWSVAVAVLPRSRRYCARCRCGDAVVSMSCMKKHSCNGDWRLVLLLAAGFLFIPQGLSEFVLGPFP